jgi:transcriptional regulator with XRE-family HTH domain
MQLGNAIRMVRTAKRMKQQEVADGTGCDVSYISLLETGRRDPTWSMLQKICSAMHVKLTLVIALTESEEPELEPYMPLVHSELWRITKKGEL